jgi:predicted MFS family arabinose efflux permease
VAGDTPAGSGQGGYAQVLGSRIFASYAPLAFFGSGGFSAIQSLWAGPWLVEVAGLSRGATAEVLFIYGASLLIGNLMVGAVASRLQRWPGASRRWYVGSLAVAALSLGTIISNRFPASSGPWFAYGLTLGAGMLAYPALTRAFPAAIAGRVVTSYNMVMFMGGFVLQSALGVAIQALVDAGWPRVQAYQWAFGGLLAAQLAALLWFAVVSRKV